MVLRGCTGFLVPLRKNVDPMTEDELDELDRLEREATPGPITVVREDSEGGDIWFDLWSDVHGSTAHVGEMAHASDNIHRTKADAELYVALRNHARGLIDLVRRKELRGWWCCPSGHEYMRVDGRGEECSACMLQDENKKLRALLVSVEWAGGPCEPHCVKCGETESFGHEENCELAEALK